MSLLVFIIRMGLLVLHVHIPIHIGYFSIREIGSKQLVMVEDIW